jgi:acyl carrier protein
VADIWRTVLDLTQVGVDDNFFDLGGHSLLCVRVHAMLRERFRVDVPIVQLFQSPTVRSLAAFLDGEARTPAHDDAKHRAARQRDALRR